MPRTDVSRHALHARSRFLERYGVVLTIAELRALERRLYTGEGLLIRRQPDCCEVRVIRHGERLVTVAYDTITHEVKTFLPANATLRTGRRRRAR